jgi:two-component sensor histidine kinase
MTYLFFCFAGHLAQASSMLEEYLLLSDLVAENESKYASIVRNQLQDNLALKWSNYLHNEIQSRLLAIVLSDKRRLIKSKLEDINSRIEKKSFIDEVGRYPRSSLISKNLDYLQNLWRSIITIDFKLDRKLSEVELNQTIVIEILEVVNELIANAVRHGEATRIEFSIESRSNNRYFISAVNNGLPYRVSKKGLGSVLLDEIAPSNWSIRNSGKLVKTELILIENKKSI